MLNVILRLGHHHGSFYAPLHTFPPSSSSSSFPPFPPFHPRTSSGPSIPLLEVAFLMAIALGNRDSRAPANNERVFTDAGSTV